MSVSAKKSVELFYDVVSPYSWIAFEVLCRYRQKWNIDLKFRPFFLGGVMQGAENQPPGVNRRKGVYMTKELIYLRKHYNLPIKFPSNPGETVFGHAVSLSPMRFLTAIDLAHPEYLEEVSRQFWLLVWSKDLTVNKPEHITEGAKAAGLSDAAIKDALSKMGDPAVKNRLKETTAEALAYGTFGAPTIVATDAQNQKHMLFGSDRMHILADILGEEYEGPLADLPSKM